MVRDMATIYKIDCVTPFSLLPPRHIAIPDIQSPAICHPDFLSKKINYYNKGLAAEDTSDPYWNKELTNRPRLTGTKILSLQIKTLLTSTRMRSLWIRLVPTTTKITSLR